MPDVLLLHTIADAKHCAESGQHKGKLLFSTYAGISGYLKDGHGIDCRCVSEYITQLEQSELCEEAAQRCGAVLSNLDNKFAQKICQDLGLKELSIFQALYSYLGKHQLLSYLSLVRSLKRIFEENKPSKIYIYEYEFCDNFSSRTNIEDLRKAFFQELTFNTISSSENGPQPSYSNDRRAARFSMLLKNPRYIFNKVKERYLERTLFARVKKISAGKPTVLISEDLYDLEVLKRNIKDVNLIYINSNGTNPFLHSPKADSELSAPHIDKASLIELLGTDPLDLRFALDVVEDLLVNFKEYFNPLCLIAAFINGDEQTSESAMKIDLGIWGNPPISGAKTLIFELLRIIKVPVLGAQHGCVDGDCYQPWHTDSDFNMADHFISYGFTNHDIQRLYPDLKSRSKIYPLGSTRKVMAGSKTSNNSAKVDILFPITDALSIFSGGMARVKPDELMLIQEKLIEELEALNDLKIVVKPFMFSGYHNSAVWARLKRSKKLDLLENVPLRDVLERSTPRVVVIEYLSQPLYDALPLDCEIFLLGNDIHYFEKDALEMLKKRVWYFENIEALVAALKQYFRGELSKKRDSEFMDHYFKKASPAAISGLILDLVAGGHDNRVK